MLGNRAVQIFNDNAMMHFRKLLQQRQKQLTLDKFLVKNTPRLQIIYNCIDVSRHLSERIDRLLTILYGKYCFTFRTNKLSTRFMEQITLDIRGSTE